MFGGLQTHQDAVIALLFYLKHFALIITYKIYVLRIVIGHLSRPIFDDLKHAFVEERFSSHPHDSF
jgi:hypothetical protein